MNLCKRWKPQVAAFLRNANMGNKSMKEFTLGDEEEEKEHK